MRISLEVSTTPPSRATMRFPAVRTTPNPVFAIPGSIPMTITPLHSRKAGGCPFIRLWSARRCRLLEDLLGNVEVGVHRVDVVVLLERIHQPEQGRRIALPHL